MKDKEVVKNQMRQSDKNNSKQIRVDSKWHRLLKIMAAEKDIGLKDLVDEICEKFFEHENNDSD